MEDPWTTNPPSATGWDAKVSTSRLPGEEESRHTPPPTFDVGDPWGVSAASSHALDPPAPASQPPLSPARHDPLPASASAPGWEDSTQPWGITTTQIPAVASTISPTSPQVKMKVATEAQEHSHDAVWSLDSPTQQLSALPTISHPPSTIVASDIPLPISPGPSTPPPSFAAFAPTSHAFTPRSKNASTSAQASPMSIHSTQDDGGFGSPSPNLVSLPMTLPRSPSFGDDFGGFSAGPSFANTNNTVSDADPWGTGHGVGESNSTEVPMPSWGPAAGGDDQDDWAGDMSFGDTNAIVDQHSNFVDREDVDDNDDGQGEGWGMSRVPQRAMPIAGDRDKSGGDDEWEEAQRRIRIKLERAPQEKIDALISAWTELGNDVGVQGIELPKKTGAEEMKFEEEVKQAQDDVYEKLRSLSMIPPDINTYPPVISSLVTHERYTYALTRPNPTPSTSLLTTAARRPRRFDLPDTTLTSTSEGPSWTNRSRLGEPDGDALATAAAASNQPVEENKSRWSFWRKPTLERQLTTSGGGILEVKQTPISPSLSNNGSVSGSRARASTDNKPGSIAPASSRPASIISKPSRPASPAPTSATLSPSLSLPPITQDTGPSGHSAPSGQIPQAATAPSAVSRFFGRLSRKPSTTAQTEEDIDGKDIELTADDFSYLAEVPSITSPPTGQGVEDLLSLEGPTLPAKSLDNVLKGNNAPLPKPLAPPPASRSVSTSSNGGRFVAKMKAPPPTDFDLLGDLDFAPSSSSNGATTAQSQTTATPTSAWDDFLAFDSATSPSQPLAEASQPASTISPLPQVSQPTSPFPREGSGTPTLSLSPPPAQSSSTFPTFHNSLSPMTQQQQLQSQPSAVLATLTPNADPSGFRPGTKFGDELDVDDFAFGTPQNASTAQMPSASFDDFGDFSAFEEPPQPPQHQPQVQVGDIPKPRPLSAFVQSSQPSYATPTSKSKQQNQFETPNYGLDHTPTLTLLSNASASKGRRWPAPPSPGAPILEPPPKVGSYPTSNAGGGGFPFLSPPPGASFRPVSRNRNLLDDGDITNNRDEQEGGGGGGGGNTNTILPPPSSAFGAALAPKTAQAFPATQPPPSPPRQQQPSSNGGIGGGGGLSAQDLSFFDSL